MYVSILPVSLRILSSQNFYWCFGWDTNICKDFKSVLQIMLITSLYLHISYLKFMIEFTGFSMVSDSQGPTDFSAQLGFSEDSNSQSSEPSSKRLKTDCS